MVVCTREATGTTPVSHQNLMLKLKGDNSILASEVHL